MKTRNERILIRKKQTPTINIVNKVKDRWTQHNIISSVKTNLEKTSKTATLRIVLGTLPRTQIGEKLKKGHIRNFFFFSNTNKVHNNFCDPSTASFVPFH